MFQPPGHNLNSPLVAAFGERAARIANWLPTGVNAVITDVSNLQLAYMEAVSRRSAGQRFYGMVLVDDPRTLMCNTVAKMFTDSNETYDTRYSAMQKMGQGILTVNDKPIRESWDNDSQPWGIIKEFLGFCEATLVRSVAESTRIHRGAFPRSFRRFVQEPSLPPFERRAPARPTVCIWAGNAPSMYCSLPLLALEEFRGDVFYVAPQMLPKTPHRWMSPDDPNLADALSRTSCVVTVDPLDPSDGIAFARRGVPVVAPETAGLHEYVFGTPLWNGCDGIMLLHSVAHALANEVSVALEPPAVPPLVAPPLNVKTEELPLVTIITPTYNRRDWLEKVLGCIAAQTYPKIESMIVNDAGEPVDDIVAKFPFARLINAPVNGGALAACGIGFEASRGEFIMLLPDDDWLYPDHVERLVGALLRTGSAIANSRSLVRFIKRDEGNDEEYTFGFNNTAYSTTATTSQAQIGTPVANHQLLQRRDTFDPDDVGWWLADTIVADQEYHMRLTERYSFVFVDHVTSEFRDHPANSGKAHNWSEAMEDIYERVRPLADRPLLQAERRMTVQILKSVPVGENVNKPSFFVERGEVNRPDAPW